MRKNNIVWYCGKDREPWNPVYTGFTSGSQECVINLSREWRRRGHSVKVYNFCKGHEGVFDEVEYIDYDKFDPSEAYDVLIIWRDKNISSLDYDLNAGKIFLQLQDLPYHKRVYTKERVMKLDRIITLSKYHRNQYLRQPWAPWINDGLVRVIPNGMTKDVYPDDFPGRKDFGLIYASEYSRGLEHMLEHGWPVIKERIPPAELSVCFGWDSFDTQRKIRRQPGWKEKMEELLCQPGIKELGRLKKDELYRLKAGSAIHYYGSTFPETDCVSVRESAYLGCVPVTTELAALGEKPYCVKVGGDPESPETQRKLAETIAVLIEDQKRLARIRKKFQRRVKKETWDIIARRWEKEF